MIGGLRGKLARKRPGIVLVDCGGVLYEVHLSLQACASLPEEGTSLDLEVVTHVREDAFQLFGFLDEAEKAVFHWLRSVNGVGPKLALNILSGMPASEICTALADGDTARLVKIPGVGKKVSERLVMELRDKAAESGLGDAAPGDVGGGETGASDEEALSVLVNLGYKEAQAKGVLATLPEGLSLEETLRQALRGFAK